MKCEILKSEGCSRSFNILVPESKMNEYENPVIDEFEKNSKIKGFRPGKAPKNMVIRHYNSQIKTEVLNKSIQKILSEAFKELKIQPITEPNIEKFEYDLSKDLEIEGVVEVFPEFELGKYDKLKLERLSDVVEDKDVMDYMKQMADYSAPFETVEDREVAIDDYAIVDFEIFDGDRSAEKKDGSWVKIINETDDSYLKDFCEFLTGMKIGEEKDVDINLPKTYADEKLAGKKAKMHISLTGIRKKIVPEINDDYAKKISAEFETLDQYKEKVKEFLSNQKKLNVTQNLKDQVKKHLIESNVFEPPKNVLQKRVQDFYSYKIQQLMTQGAKKEDLDLQKEEIFGSASIEAGEQLKLEFIYGKIIDKEKLEVTDEDFQKGLEDEGSKVGMAKDAFEKYMKANKRLPVFRQNLLIDKIFTLIIDRATIKEIGNK